MKLLKITSVFMLVLLVAVQATPAYAGLLLGAQDRARLSGVEDVQTTNSLQETATKKRADEARTAKVSRDGRWLLAYYVGYHHEYLKPENIDYSLMTHIVVGGVGVRGDGTLDPHFHLENGDGRALASEVRKRAHEEGVQALLWLGGPNEEDLFLSASSNATRATFIRNILKLVRELGYDGVDLDWEPIRRQDETWVYALVRDLRRADPDLLITVPVNWVPTTIAKSKELSVYPRLARNADKLFIMSYSMAGPWAGWKSWHGGALDGDTTTTPGSLSTSVDAYRAAGVPRDKLGIGIGTYATCWQYPVQLPQQQLPNGYSSRRLKAMSMRTLMDEYYFKRYEKWDSSAHVPYLSLPVPFGSLKCGFVSYENEQSITAKMQYMKEQQLGGVLVWNIGTGFYPDRVQEKQNPLLRTVYENL